MDDSASALDFATDLKLRRAIHNLGNEMTVFIVSQRASTVRAANQILVLDDGSLVRKGTHDELMENCKVYQEIYYSQFPEEKTKGGYGMKKNTSFQTLGKVLKFIGKYKVLFVFSVTLSIVAAILQLYVPILFGDAIDTVIKQGEIHYSQLISTLINIGICITIASISLWVMNLINNRLTYQTVKEIRAKAMRHIQHIPLILLIYIVQETSFRVSLRMLISYLMVCCWGLRSYLQV